MAQRWVRQKETRRLWRAEVRRKTCRVSLRWESEKGKLGEKRQVNDFIKTSVVLPGTSAPYKQKQKCAGDAPR